MIVFDLDDTLYHEADFVRSGRAVVASLPECSDIDGPWSPAMLDAYRTHFPDIKLSDDACEALQWLKAQGVSIGLVTDGRSLTQRNKIRALGLYDYILDDNIIISEEVGADKTSATPFLQLMGRNTEQKSWVYIGDNPAKDFFQPNRLGWTSVMLADDTGANIHPQSVPVGDGYAPSLTVNSLYQFVKSYFKSLC